MTAPYTNRILFSGAYHRYSPRCIYTTPVCSALHSKGSRPLVSSRCGHNACSIKTNA